MSKGATTIENTKLALANVVVSVNVKLTEKVPATFGVPSSCPADVRDNPGGKPVTLPNEYAAPPYGVNVKAKGAPTSAVGGAVELTICSGVTVIVAGRSSVLPPESVRRIDVVRTPGVVKTPSRPADVVPKNVGNGGATCRRVPAGAVALGLSENEYGG